ncbi:MAG: universal stress protein [Archangium sp.]|nr:universal stress protein [Archangium sp.]
MTIVCATHFSPSSANAVAVAALLARQSSERLWLTSVVPHSRIRPAHKEGREAGQALQGAAELLRKQGVEVETRLLRGATDRSVARQCDDVQAELLVVGDTHRKKTRYLNTSADRFASEAHVPMLVVRNPEPFEAWSKGLRALKVFLAVDQSGSAAGAPQWLTKIARSGPLEVTVYAWGPLKTRLDGLPANATFQVNARQGRFPTGASVLALAAAEKADVVLLGAKAQRGPLGRRTSVAHEVLVDAPISVALLPEAEELTTTLPLFVHQRRGALSLGAVALVLVGALATTGLLVKTYRDGVFEEAGCQVVCRGP